MMSGERIGVIAGSGAFPLEIAASIERSGNSVYVVGLRGFAERGVRSYPYIIADMLDPHRILGALRNQGITKLVLAGGVARPGPMALFSIYTFFRNREELRRIVSGGDDRILRGVVRLFNEEGFEVLGVDQVAPDLLAPLGGLGQVKLNDESKADIELALNCIETMGRFDFGQGVVVGGGRILAVEGPEGTDAMLRRVRDLQRSRRVSLEKPSAILVKASKPDQDRRVDLPAIGPKTVYSASKAGLIGIAVAAHDVILVEKERLIRDADRCGIFIAGVKA
ncbi:MAG: UDP-2,3-diacylglucosamine diphosphatase LpxI [Beijerinckiaceae bacterium]|nr:UDP-2,3-diacylglucosamine diphosphatase LpxI [Beijerinckiaceae bacterium]